MNQSASNEILETIQDLKSARDNLKRITDQFSDEPELREIYSHSAQELTKNLENHLQYLLNIETDSEFTITSTANDVDIWVHIEGDKFSEGRGPINSVGSYLKKLDTAVQHTINVLRERAENLRDLEIESYFELAETAKGSLKLGLKSKIDGFNDDYEETLFNEDPEVKMDQLEIYSQIQQLSSNGLVLLLKTLSSADDDQAIKEIFQDYGEDDAIKLIHYAKELAPSSRSNISEISFEGRSLPKSKPYIKTNRDTRRNLMIRSTKLINNKEFIEGTALIEQYKNNVNEDYYSLFAKPLKYNKKTINIELRISKNKHNIREKEVLNEFLDIEGFLHFNNRSNPTYVIVDKLSYDRDEDVGFSEGDD